MKKSTIFFLLFSIVAVIGLSFLYSEGKLVFQTVTPAVAEEQATEFELANVKTIDGKLIEAHELIPSQSCMTCHSDVYEQWSVSLHARSAANDPIYEGHEETYAVKEIGENGIQFCAACHTPEAHVTGSIGKTKWTDRKYEDAGTSCIVCHAITDVYDIATFDSPGNASYVISPETVHEYPFENTKVEALRNFIVRGAPQQHVEDYSRPLYKEAEYCASCHSQASPDGFIEQDTYREWKQSVYADENSPEYKTCITCHMATTPGDPSNVASGYTTDRGKNKDQVFDHRFVGANQALPYFYGDEEMFERTEQMLKSAAEIEIVDVKQTMEQLDFKVKVTNVGAGHNLPTGATDLRQLWLDIEVLNEKGDVIYTSGKLDNNHEVDPEAVMFHSKFYDADGNLVTHHQVWRVTRKEDNLIPPKGSKFGRYSIPLEGDSKQYTVIAKLRYRVAPQYFADVVLRKFGGAGFNRTLPITDIDEVKQVISVE